MARTTPQPPRLRCPHCASDATVRWGVANGVPRYRCNSCDRTFNALTRTPLARLQHKKRLIAYFGTIAARRSVQERADICKISASTSARWRRRFEQCSATERVKMLGALAVAYGAAQADSELSSLAELLPRILSLLV